MILMGGPSEEHEVSLHTGEQIMRHLDPKRYQITSVIIAKNGQWMIDAPHASMGQLSKEKDVQQKACAVSQATALAYAADRDIDVAFIALHGAFGEDGTLQAILDAVNIPYTGSGVRASALGLYKPLSSSVFRDAGFNVPAFRVIHTNELKKSKEKIVRELIKEFSLPLVVKPPDQGSSIGITIVGHIRELIAALTKASVHSPEIMVQKFIAGRELTCGVIEKGGTVCALPPVEIIPKAGAFYDYASKYADGGSDHLISPSDMDKKTIKMIQDSACRAHQVIGCSGMSRTDFILDNDGKLYILEINTIPGMTSTSLLPQSAAHIGITFPKLLDMLIRSALRSA